LKEALLYEKLEKDKVKCNLCPKRCVIAPSKRGYCQVRANEEGILYTLVYGKCSSVAVDPIEKKPLFHFYPGSSVFSLGTVGCNFRCIHCQNWTIAHAKPGAADNLRHISPEEAVQLAEEYHCQGIAWTYNEPTIWFEYTLDTAKLCQKKGLYTVYVTNGYITEEALDMIGPYLDAYRVDVKGFSNDFYKKLAKVSDFFPVLDMAIYAKQKWNMHVEIVTNVIPTLNDGEEELRGIAHWIRENLGEETPWHVTRFMPHLELSHLPPTPVRTLEKARDIGFKEGLHFVYIGNVWAHPGENTYCYNCQNLVIERTGYNISLFEVEQGKCKFCGKELNIRPPFP